MADLSAPGFGEVGAGIVTLDKIRPGAAYAKGVCEFALDAGDGGVEYGFGFCAEGLHFIFPKRRFIVEGLLGIEGAKLFPVGDQVVCRNAFRMGEIQAEEGAFNGVEVNPGGGFSGALVTFFRQQEKALPAALNNVFMKSPAHCLFCKVRQPGAEKKVITSL